MAGWRTLAYGDVIFETADDPKGTEEASCAIGS